MVKDYSQFELSEEEIEAMKVQNPEKFATRKLRACDVNLNEITMSRGFDYTEESELISGAKEIISELRYYFSERDYEVEIDADSDVVQLLKEIGEKRQERQRREEYREYNEADEYPYHSRNYLEERMARGLDDTN